MVQPRKSERECQWNSVGGVAQHVANTNVLCVESPQRRRLGWHVRDSTTEMPTRPTSCTIKPRYGSPLPLRR